MHSSARHGSLLNVILRRSLGLNMNLHLRLVLVVVLDLLDGLLRLRRGLFHVDAGGFRHQIVARAEVDESAFPVEMHTIQVPVGNTVHVAGRGELKQALFGGFGNARLQFVVQRVLRVERMARIERSGC